MQPHCIVYSREAKEVFSSRGGLGENEGKDSCRSLEMSCVSYSSPGGSAKMPRVLDVITLGNCSSREQPRSFSRSMNSLEASLHPRMEAHTVDQWERSGCDISIEVKDGSSAGSSIVASLGVL